jgi:large subunit ribosomal protein L10
MEGFVFETSNTSNKRRCNMPKIEQKQVVINEIKGKIARAKSIIIVDARGLSVESDTVLRKKLREAGVDYKVYKNTMVNFALEGTEFESLKQHLAGPSAFAFSYDDPLTAAKIISKELKGMPAIEFKAGFLEGTMYDGESVKAIANIPPREELLARLLGSFKSPMSSFARVISQIAQKKGGGPPAAQEETAAAEPPAEPVTVEETA